VKLIDHEGRMIRKLRVSLTDKCNLRCHYCMPVNQQFMDESNYLAASSYREVIGELCDYGLQEVRLTGGEPLMRRSFIDILEQISTLPLKKISLTTNAIMLDKYLHALKANRVFHLNISLDSLDEKNFKRITYGNHLGKILENIRMARQQGFIIKLNAVMMKGVNDHELLDFVKFSSEEKIEVRFLELMRIGHACTDQSEQFISASEMIKKIKLHHQLKFISMPADSTSFNYLTESSAQIGFIASESQPFCGQCSRWRLSADGILRACLLKNDGLSVKNTTSLERLDIYQKLLGMKPSLRPAEVGHQMNTIGG
jgi:GTP 3',8-cyclase